MTKRSPIGTGDERWLRIVVGYTAASFAAGYTLTLEFFLPDALLRALLPNLGVFLSTGFLLFVLIGLLAMLPTVYVISLGEARRWRSPAFHAAAGVGAPLVWVAVLLPLAVGSGVPGIERALANGTLLLALPGLVGGLVYWSIAGRSAGREP